MREEPLTNYTWGLEEEDLEEGHNEEPLKERSEEQSIVDLRIRLGNGEGSVVVPY